MNYLDVYFSRLNHLGNTTAERIRNSGQRSFEKWLAESPHTVRNLSVERGIYFDGIILTSKDKEYEKIMFLEVTNDIPIKVGDIMNWTLDDNSIEKWILIQEEKKVNGTFRSFWIVRCNYLIRWIDKNGHIQESWAYFVSSLNSKIKGNFRTWNDLITPQPNKYAELLLPFYEIDRATNFIVEKESWSVVEYDYSSVPGVIYLSLTESKVNGIYDDVENNLADLDKLATYKLLLPEIIQKFKIGDIVIPHYTLIKNGKICDEELEFFSSNLEIVRPKKVKISVGDIEIDEEEKLVAIQNGRVEIIAQLKQQPEIQFSIVVLIGDELDEIMAYIEGNDNLRLDRTGTYILKSSDEILEDINFSIDNKELAMIVNIDKNQCEVRANSRNKIGKVILSAEYNNKIYKKEISIIPLWQVIL